jgi:hypothetical protein
MNDTLETPEIDNYDGFNGICYNLLTGKILRQRIRIIFEKTNREISPGYYAQFWIALLL